MPDDGSTVFDHILVHMYLCLINPCGRGVGSGDCTWESGLCCECGERAEWDVL